MGLIVSGLLSFRFSDRLLTLPPRFGRLSEYLVFCHCLLLYIFGLSSWCIFTLISLLNMLVTIFSYSGMLHGGSETWPDGPDHSYSTKRWTFSW